MITINTIPEDGHTVNGNHITARRINPAHIEEIIEQEATEDYKFDPATGDEIKTCRVRMISRQEYQVFGETAAELETHIKGGDRASNS